MSSAKPMATPMMNNIRLSNHNGENFSDLALYRSVMGSLQYTTITRPDIAYSVNMVSQFMHNPGEDHWRNVKRILRYLNGTINQGLKLKGNKNMEIKGYAGFDWVSDPGDRRSTTGCVLYFGDNPIC